MQSPIGSQAADLVDGAIGEASPFHESFSVYGQGVTLATATLPDGWRDRLIPFTHGHVGESRAMCIDPHDLVVSKLVANREKDLEFVRAVVIARLVDTTASSTSLPHSRRRRASSDAFARPSLESRTRRHGSGTLDSARHRPGCRLRSNGNSNVHHSQCVNCSDGSVRWSP